MSTAAFVTPMHGLGGHASWTPAAGCKAMGRMERPWQALRMTDARASTTRTPARRKKLTRAEREARRRSRLGISAVPEKKKRVGWFGFSMQPYENEEGYMVDPLHMKLSHKILASALTLAVLMAAVNPPSFVAKPEQREVTVGGKQQRKDLIQTAAGQMMLWEDLTGKQKVAAELLGFDKKLWDEDGKVAVDRMTWNKLTPVQQRAAGVLAIDKDLWDKELFVDIYERSWAELSQEQRTAAKVLGFVKASWDQEQHVWSDDAYWKQLTVEQQRAGETIGYTQEEWDGTRHIYDRSWDFLTAEQSQAARDLGYNKKRWDRDMYVPSDDLYWKQLSDKERKAAKALGFKEQDWNQATNAGSHSKDLETERKRRQREKVQAKVDRAAVPKLTGKGPNGCENELQGPFSYSRCKRSSVPYYVPRIMQGTAERATFPFGMGKGQ